jgi:H+/gluconate symporter-like permease
MDVLLIVLVLCLLMFMAYRGFSTILIAPICGLLLVAFAAKPLLPAFTELFMIRTVGYVKSFFPIFLLGSIFGQLMGDSGFARSIAKAIIKYFGKERALLAVCLTGSILTYGGVSLLVVTFAVYPFAAALYKEANIPKRFLIGAMVTGAFTATLGAYPGSPQIQNIIPAAFFGTNIYASPGIGLITGTVLWLCSYFYMYFSQKKAMAAGEGYGENHINEPLNLDENKPTIKAAYAMIPLLSVLAINFYMGRIMTWDPTLLDPYKIMKLPLLAGAVKNVSSSWATIVALTVGSALVLIMGRRYFSNGWTGILKSLNAGANGALLAIMNTAILVGFGSLMATSAGFKGILDGLMGIQIGDTPLWSMAVASNVLAGLTGSASGGISIALDLMGPQWLAWANNAGVPLDIMTRVAAIASGGLSLTPHNGALITMFVVCGLSHKTSYLDVAIISIFKGSASFLAIILYTMFGNF